MKQHDCRQLCKQTGGVTTIAIISLLAVAGSIVLSQMRSTKIDNAMTNAKQIVDTEAQQAAANALAEGIKWVNSLSSLPTFCTTACNNGVYKNSISTALQDSSWWNSNNAHQVTNSGSSSKAFYAIEYLGCNTSTGEINYKIIGCGMSDASKKVGLQNQKPVVLSRTMTGKAGTTPITYYIANLCPSNSGTRWNSQNLVTSASATVSFTAVNTAPSSTFLKSTMPSLITEVGAVINATVSDARMNLEIRINGDSRFNQKIVLPRPGSGACSIGATRQMTWVTLPTPVSVFYGDTVQLVITGCTDTNWGSVTCSMSSSSNSSSGLIYGVKGLQYTCPM